MANQKTTKHGLKIYRGNIEAGLLSRTKDGCTFTFAPTFLSNRAYKGLSYSMSKTPDPQITRGTNLHPFFAGLLPEGLRLKALIKNSKTSADDLFTLFTAVGANVIGDVFVQSEVEKEKYDPPKLKDIDFYEYFKSLLTKDSYALGDEAIAGVQEKVSAAMISFPVNIAKETKSYILKLNPPDKPNLVRNELIITTLARRCEIETSTVKIVRDKAGNEGLLVERFDRVWNKDFEKFDKIHQEDSCQFLNRYPADKYRLTMSEIVKGMQEIATVKQAATLKVLRVFCFSYLIGNGDLHAKNISLYNRPDQPNVIDLTPAYDLLTTYIYKDERMALKLDGKDDNISRKMIIAFGERFGIPSKSTSNMLDRLLNRLDSYKELIDDIPMDSRERTKLSKVIAKRTLDLKA